MGAALDEARNNDLGGGVGYKIMTRKKYWGWLGTWSDRASKH